MSPVLDQDRTAEHNEAMESELQHLDQALNDAQVPEFEEEIELWTTYGGD